MTLRLTNSNPIHPTLRQPSAPGERATRIALYSHDTQGLGHLRRNLLIASSLVRMTPRPTILLIGGAREVGAFNIPPGVDCLTVPSLSKSETGGYGVRSLDVCLAELVHTASRSTGSAPCSLLKRRARRLAGPSRLRSRGGTAIFSIDAPDHESPGATRGSE